MFVFISSLWWPTALEDDNPAESNGKPDTTDNMVQKRCHHPTKKNGRTHGSAEAGGAPLWGLGERCTYGWPLPCLLDYCPAGPRVAAAAPPLYLQLSGTTPRGRKPVTVCSCRFLFWFGGGSVFGSWDRCAWLCRGFSADSRPTARWATFDHAWRGYFSAAKKEIYIYVYIHCL